jgi:diguanylate cyclase (GGDEF)-like protein/PAS domain S-box-containing protein
MRVPAWLTATVTVALLLALGGVGWQMNRSALRTAESVHRADVLLLADNNTALAGEYLAVSARELSAFVRAHPADLRTLEAADRPLLDDLVRHSVFFRHGAALVNTAGHPVASVAGRQGLPDPHDPGYAPLRQPANGRPFVFSDVLSVEGTSMLAVGVPILGAGRQRGVLVGYMLLRDSAVQASITKLGRTGALHGILDSSGALAASSDRALLGTRVPEPVRAALRERQVTPEFVEYTDRGRDMVAVVAGGMPGGWAYYRAQTADEFYGPTRSTSLLLALALLGVILVAGVSLTVVTQRAAAVRRRTEARFAAMVQHSTDCISLLDPTGRIVWDSPSLTTVLGFPHGARLGMLAGEVLHPADRAAARAAFADLLQRPGETARVQCRAMHHDGSYRWVDMSVTNLVDNPAIRGLVVNGRDISDSRELQERLVFQATHDTLTGLANRRLLHDRLAGSLGRDPERAPTVAVLYIDLDRFKPVNDELGHEAGDELLRQVGRRLSGCLRTQDLLSRVGGDEFVALLDGIASREEATMVATRIIAELRRPFDVLGHEVTIGASVGLSFSSPGATVDQVLGGADAAMYRAKQSGGLRYTAAA